MANKEPGTANKPYIAGVLILTFGLPALSFLMEWLTGPHRTGPFLVAGKWFIFYAVGCRLLLAGARQIANPAFTAKDIFRFEGNDSFPVIRELGFANLCFGAIGMMSLLLPHWRVVSAFGSGLYYGLAGLYHWLKKPAGINERFALVTDVIIFLLLVLYLATTGWIY